jgi:hypothetical protein
LNHLTLQKGPSPQVTPAKSNFKRKTQVNLKNQKQLAKVNLNACKLMNQKKEEAQIKGLTDSESIENPTYHNFSPSVAHNSKPGIPSTPAQVPVTPEDGHVTKINTSTTVTLENANELKGLSQNNKSNKNSLVHHRKRENFKPHELEVVEGETPTINNCLQLYPEQSRFDPTKPTDFIGLQNRSYGICNSQKSKDILDNGNFRDELTVKNDKKYVDSSVNRRKKSTLRHHRSKLDENLERENYFKDTLTKDCILNLPNLLSDNSSDNDRRADYCYSTTSCSTDSVYYCQCDTRENGLYTPPKSERYIIPECIKCMEYSTSYASVNKGVYLYHQSRNCCLGNDTSYEYYYNPEKPLTFPFSNTHLYNNGHLEQIKGNSLNYSWQLGNGVGKEKNICNSCNMRAYGSNSLLSPRLAENTSETKYISNEAEYITSGYKKTSPVCHYSPICCHGQYPVLEAPWARAKNESLLQANSYHKEKYLYNDSSAYLLRRKENDGIHREYQKSSTYKLLGPYKKCRNWSCSGYLNGYENSVGEKLCSSISSRALPSISQVENYQEATFKLHTNFLPPQKPHRVWQQKL